jgi:hypothetical protein
MSGGGLNEKGNVKGGGMRGRAWRWPSPGTVMGGLALVVAVAGNANAFAGRDIVIHRGEIAKGAVTAKALAKGAVHARALAKGAVHARALAKGAVTSAAIGNDAVTAVAIAPGSVYGGALGPVTVHTAIVKDADTVPHNGEWTASSTSSATCSPGERLLTGGVAITKFGTQQVALMEDRPFMAPTSSGEVGAITTDSGGTAEAEVEAICLK